MAIATQTLTVNAAFLREIKDDNRQLDELLAALRELTSCGASVRACGQQFVQLLAQLHKQLFFRFALEEELGYFDDAIDVAPHVAERAARLKAEHRPLLEWIADMAGEAEQWRHGGGSERYLLLIAGRFHRFDEAWLRHEANEDELILSAMHEDLGVGD